MTPRWLWMVMILGVVLGVGWGWPLVARAAGGIEVSPVFHDISLETDTDKSLEVTFENQTDSFQALRMSVVDFGSLDESGGIAFLGQVSATLKERYSLASWVSLERDELLLAPGQSDTLKITIENRASLSPGGHYAALVAELTEDASRNSISLQGAVSSLFFVNKAGGALASLSLTPLQGSRFHLALPSKLLLRFHNQGNVHVVPRGTVVVKDGFGRLVMQGSINEDSSLILPESFRVYPMTLRSVQFLKLPGRYTLDVAYRYDGTESIQTETVVFYFLPWGCIVGLILGLGIVIQIFRIQKRKKHVIPQNTPPPPQKPPVKKIRLG